MAKIAPPPDAFWTFSGYSTSMDVSFGCGGIPWDHERAMVWSDAVFIATLVHRGASCWLLGGRFFALETKPVGIPVERVVFRAFKKIPT